MAVSPIVHVEFAARDPQVTAKFYASLFGWQTDVDEALNYHMFSAEGGPGGGFVAEGGELQMQPREVIVYAGMDDIEGTLARVEELGGKILTPKTEIPHVGWFAIASDPDGRRFGLFTRSAM